MNEEIRVLITAEIDKLKQELEAAKREVEDFEKESKSSLDNFNSAMSTVGGAANNAMKAVGTAVVGAGAALLGLTAATEELRVNQAKLETTFESVGGSAETAKQTYNDLYRVLGDDAAATEAAQSLALLTTNQQDLSEWTTICQGVYAQMGEKLPINSLAEAANETAKVGTVTGALADALNWAGISEDDFNEKLAACNTEAEREKLIRESLSGIYGDAAAMYETTGAEILAQNEAQIQLNDATVKLGEALAPVNTALTSFAATFLEQIQPVIQDFIDNHGADLTEALEKIASAIGTVIGFIVDNWELIGTIAAVIMAIVVAINLYNAAMAVYNVLMAPVNLVILAIVAAIVALIAIITLVVVYWDELKAAALACWDKIKEVWNTVAEWFSNKVVTPIKNFFSGMWDGLKNGAKAAWDGVKSVFSKVGSFFKDTFTKAWTAVKNIFSVGGKIFDGIKDGIVNAFKTIVNGIIKGINKVVSVPFNAINKVLDKLRGLSILGVSPFSWIGSINVPQIPLLAKGGIIDSATLAMVGEQGKEAVVPLENNMEWLDKIASMLADRLGGGNRPIILQVDGKTFARTSIDTINQLTKQTGSLDLVIV